jgi:hypothetical protein
VGTFSVPFANPTRMSVLKNGFVAVTDSATPRVAVFDPADGSLQGIYSPCPEPDAGHGSKLDFVSDITPGE